MRLLREPEPEIVMETAEAVEAFDWAGEPGGPLFAAYQVNAEYLSRRVPEGATVVDLFCGSARLIRRLLRGRPDLSAVGIDLSARMLDVASASVAEAGLADRVELIRADASTVDEVVEGPVGAVASLSALHHCPTRADLVSVLAAVRRVRERDGAAVWLFDLVRPADEALIERIPRSYELTSGARLPPAFRTDWMTSLRAGWTFSEFRDACAESGLDLDSAAADYSQLHRADPLPAPSAPSWEGSALEPADRHRVERLAAALGLA